MTNSTDLLQDILDYRTDDKHRFRGDFGESERRQRDALQDHLAAILKEYFSLASLPDCESMFDSLKTEDDYFTQVARDALHERSGVPRKPSVVTWQTKSASNTTGLDDN